MSSYSFKYGWSRGIRRFPRRWTRQPRFASSICLQENSESPAKHHIDSRSIAKRPRLQALRERLQQEVAQPSLTTHRRTNAKPIVTKHIAAQPQQIKSYEEGNHSALIDRFGRQHTYLRLSLTERCNLRCTYCMPEHGLQELPAYVLTTSQLLDIAEYFHSRGVTKFRLTGGEPTLRRDLVDIVAGLRALPNTKTVGMTTNGIALNAKKLHDLNVAGLTHLNISLDTLDEHQFARITRRPYFAKVWKTLEAAMAMTDVLSVKLNCVVQRNVNENHVAQFVRLLGQFPLLQVRFIEYMPFADNGWSYNECVPYRELLESLEHAGIFMKALESNDPHDTTKWYQEKTTGGKVGFISSMSQNFCSTCNRLRITADGLLKVCLFDTEKRTVDLREALVNGIPLDQVVGPAVQRKHKALGGHANPVSLGQSSGENRPMTRIGG